MKTLAILAAMTLATGAFAQGTLNASNAGAFGVRPIYVYIDASQPWLAGTSVMVELWGGPSAGSLSLLATGPVVANGLFALGTVVVPGVVPGGDAFVQVRAWESTSGATYASASWKDSSPVFTAVTGGAGSPPTTPGDLRNWFGGVSVVVPEPGSVALVGIGIAAMALVRRRA
jgi:hypothetical protein